MPRSGELEAGSKDELETVALVDDADAVRQRHGAPRSPTAARKTTTSAPSSSAAEVTRKALFVGPGGAAHLLVGLVHPRGGR